ncbi:MAG: hypothetical protein ACTSVI_05235 [Promethearchaeota archaeon]
MVTVQKDNTMYRWPPILIFLLVLLPAILFFFVFYKPEKQEIVTAIILALIGFSIIPILMFVDSFSARVDINDRGKKIFIFQRKNKLFQTSSKKVHDFSEFEKVLMVNALFSTGVKQLFIKFKGAGHKTFFKSSNVYAVSRLHEKILDWMKEYKANEH